MQSASWIAKQKTPQLGRYVQGLCSNFMQITVFVKSASLSVCMCVNLYMCVMSVFVFCTIWSFKLQSEPHETLATDNHYFYAETLLEY